MWPSYQANIGKRSPCFSRVSAQNTGGVSSNAYRCPLAPTACPSWPRNKVMPAPHLVTMIMMPFGSDIRPNPGICYAYVLNESRSSRQVPFVLLSFLRGWHLQYGFNRLLDVAP